MADQVRINGNVYSWASVHVKIDDEPYYGIKSINYGDSRNPSPVYGMGRHQAPRGMTSGKYETDPVTLSIEKKTADTIRRALAAQSVDGTSFGSPEFSIVVQYIEEGGSPITDEILRCRWKKTSSKSEEGPDAIYEEVEIQCLAILWNGMRLFEASEGAP